MVNVKEYFQDHPLDINVPFMSVDEYKTAFKKTSQENDFLIQYLATYLEYHPHAQKFSQLISGNASRIFDMLPSSFWVNDFTKEFTPLKEAVDSDLLNLEINSSNFSKDFENGEAWGSTINKIKSSDFINLEKYMLTHISNIHYLLYPAANTAHPLLLKIFPTLTNDPDAEKLFLQALITSYNLAISDFFEKNVPTEEGQIYLSTAIRTPATKISENVTPEKLRNYTRKDLVSFNEILEQIISKLINTLDETARNIKDWNEVIEEKEPDSSHIKSNEDRKAIVTLKTKIETLAGQNEEILANDNLTIPSDYIKNQIIQIENLLDTAAKNKTITIHSNKFVNMINSLLEFLHLKKPGFLQTPLERELHEANATLIQESTHFNP